MPLFHISQLSSLFITAATGGKVVLMYKWDAEAALDAIENERLTSFTGVPLHYQDLLESPGLNDRDLTSIEVVGFGPPWLRRRSS